MAARRSAARKLKPVRAYCAFADCPQGNSQAPTMGQINCPACKRRLEPPAWSLRIGSMAWQCLFPDQRVNAGAGAGLFMVQATREPADGLARWTDTGLQGASPRELLEIVTGGQLARAKLEAARHMPPVHS